MILKITPRQADLILNNIGKNASITASVKDLNKIIDANKKKKTDRK